MHDFCFTIPYGLLVSVGGLMGYTKTGSTASLAGGVGSGILLLLSGFVSLSAFEKRRNSYLAFFVETDSICSLALTYVTGQRVLQTLKIMPAGIVAALSAIMTALYLYKIATGGNHIPVKSE
uniref:LOW QUALITY PROTEIN: protein FATTY ACID EXPORT 5-like n=1 Tax=Asparagus officinalis TaxID=4686 RepID=UPI00098E7A72|nr:LOW QUALITY PROTEIN: protein FATTY ACID EXPORT 5-like [Asparagus officinalis]